MRGPGQRRELKGSPHHGTEGAARRKHERRRAWTASGLEEARQRRIRTVYLYGRAAENLRVVRNNHEGRGSIHVALGCCGAHTA